MLKDAIRRDPTAFLRHVNKKELDAIQRFEPGRSVAETEAFLDWLATRQHIYSIFPSPEGVRGVIGFRDNKRAFQDAKIRYDWLRRHGDKTAAKEMGRLAEVYLT